MGHNRRRNSASFMTGGRRTQEPGRGVCRVAGGKMGNFRLPPSAFSVKGNEVTAKSEDGVR